MFYREILSVIILLYIFILNAVNLSWNIFKSFSLSNHFNLWYENILKSIVIIYNNLYIAFQILYLLFLLFWERITESFNEWKFHIKGDYTV